MIKKIKEKEEEGKVEIPREEGRPTEDYFFPDYRITIRASSIQEAIIKLKESQNNG